MRISGQFDVTLNPLEITFDSETNNFRRMSISKKFFGELEATSRGEMLSALTKVEGSAGYVALELVEGTLSGKTGRFVLQHFGILEQGKQRLVLEVVPDSASGQLTGLTGTMSIEIKQGTHFYEFDFELAQQ